MTPIKFEDFKKADSKAMLQKMMKTAVVASAGKGKVYYVAAKNFKTIKKEAMPLFLVVEQAKAEQFRTLIKASGGSTSKGQASITKETKDGTVTNKIIVHSAEGALNKDHLGDDIKLSIGVSPVDKGWIAHSEEQEEKAQAKVTPATPKPDPVRMVRESIKQAKKEGILEPDSPQGARDAQGRKKLNIAVDDAMAKRMAEASTKVAEYGKFVRAYEDMAHQYGLDKHAEYKGIPFAIWRDLIQNMADSGYITEHIPTVSPTDKNFILAYTGHEGQVVREELLRQAMLGMQVYINHAEANLKKVVEAIREAGGKSWAFWSGKGALEAAKKSGGVSLEGTIGAWFNNIWKFEHLTGVSDLVLWTSMSELYAKVAAENYGSFKFIGFLGPTATRDQSVFNKIEQPTFVEVLNVRKQVPPPHIDWFVVDCTFAPVSSGDSSFKGQRGYWNATDKDSKKFETRQEALDEIIARYEG